MWRYLFGGWWREDEVSQIITKLPRTMAGPFFDRLRSYYLSVAAVLRGEAAAASIFPNTTDIGMSRELVYREFLRQHVPSKCNVFYGGFTFGSDGSESSQLDVIVTTDTTPQFNFHNSDRSGKSFSPVDGTIAVASIKSTLNKIELEDAFKGISTIPLTEPIDDKIPFTIGIKNYDDWPYKVIYASDGIAVESLQSHLNEFYAKHPEIPLGRRPNIIHVSGKYVILRMTEGMNTYYPKDGVRAPETIGAFRAITLDPDLQGILWVLDGIQKLAMASTHIVFTYNALINKVNRIPTNGQ